MYTKICVVGDVFNVITFANFQNGIFLGTILQGVEFSIFLLIFGRALQQCSATALPWIRSLLPTSSFTMEYSIISPCAPTTQPSGCPFLLVLRQWYLQNGLQLNPDKSEALIVESDNQLHAVTSSVSSVSVAGVDLPVAEEMKVLGVVLDQRLTFSKHVSAVARSRNFHAQAIRYIRHLLTTDLAQTLACSLILPRIDYCNAVLHGAQTYTIRKLQRVQNNAARIVLQAPRRSHETPLLNTLHWLPV